jgi:hypothetical protein
MIPIGAREGRVLHILMEIGTKVSCIDEVHRLLEFQSGQGSTSNSLLKTATA